MAVGGGVWCGGAGLGWSGSRAVAAKVLEQPGGCELHRRVPAINRCFLFQMLNAWILNSLQHLAVLCSLLQRIYGVIKKRKSGRDLRLWATVQECKTDLKMMNSRCSAAGETSLAAGSDGGEGWQSQVPSVIPSDREH